MKFDITDYELERLISAIESSNLPDKTALWNLYNRLKIVYAESKI